MGSLLLPLLLLGPLVYMMVVPQRKQKKQHAEFVASLGVGDEVVTSGGIHGTVTFVEDSVVHVEVDTDVVIRVSKASLARREGASKDEPTDDAATVADADAADADDSSKS